MNTVLDKATRDSLIARIHSLEEASTAQWGKMTVYQMLKHCTIWEELALGRTQYKHEFIGRLFGKLALKFFLKNDRPIGRGVPTSKEMIITGIGDVSSQRAAWIALLEEYAQFSNRHFVHPFFGRMTEEQIGCLAYKHNDHHLRQFNA